MNFEGSELITLFDIVLLCLRLGYACVYSGTSLVHWSSLAVCLPSVSNDDDTCECQLVLNWALCS